MHYKLTKSCFTHW